MKREVRFRGKTVDGNHWVYGSYHIHRDVTLCIASKEEIEKNIKSLIVYDGMSDWNMSVPIHTYEVIHETVGEFTGMKDQNMIDVYEGDICKQVFPADIDESQTVEQIGVVRFSDAQFEIDNYPLYVCVDFELEVIGNIHDNPDLLK